LCASVILGRAVKNEHLALGTLGLTGLITYLSMGGKKEAAPPSGAKQSLQQLKDSVKIDASSRCALRFH
jgi:F-type H+-transporting ATPase subunit k